MAQACISRLRFDPHAPPKAHVIVILQLAGAPRDGIVGTCRGFVRSSYATPGAGGCCKYGGECRYAHELPPLSDADIAWVGQSREDSREGKLFLSRAAPLPHFLELLDSGRLSAECAVHVLVGDGGAGPLRRLWSLHSGREGGARAQWGAAEGGPGPAAPQAQQQGAAPLGEGASAPLPSAAAAAAAEAAAVAPPASVGGLCATLPGLPLPALALIAEYSTDAALLPLLATCTELRSALADPQVWLRRFRTTCAARAWERAVPAHLRAPRDGTPLASQQWGAALRRAYFGFAAACQWASGLRFLREAAALRALGVTEAVTAALAAGAAGGALAPPPR